MFLRNPAFFIYLFLIIVIIPVSPGHTFCWRGFLMHLIAVKGHRGAASFSHNLIPYFDIVYFLCGPNLVVIFIY